MDFPSPAAEEVKDAARGAFRDAITTVDSPARTLIEQYVGLLEQSVLDDFDELMRLQRRQDDPNAVVGALLVGQVGYVDIRSFAARAAAQFPSVLQHVLDAGATSLILDVRSNTGGQAYVAAGIASEFLPADAIVARFVAAPGADGMERRDLVSEGGLALTLPLAVLADRWSASTAEILIGAIQDHKRGCVIGTRTFGKGQAVATLANGDTISPGEYVTPKGRAISPHGLEPDIPVDGLSPAEVCEYARRFLAGA